MVNAETSGLVFCVTAPESGNCRDVLTERLKVAELRQQLPMHGNFTLEEHRGAKSTL